MTAKTRVPVDTDEFAMHLGKTADPINRISWLLAEGLDANDYNPNVVMTRELRLLEHSLLTTGWVQPILVNQDGIIIDGFHRAMLSRESAKLAEVYSGYAPCVVLELTRAEAMLLTIRINRAKGTHVALRMSDIVRELVDVHGVEPAAIQEGIGATKQEVDLLYQEGIFKHRNLRDYRYSKAWVPQEVPAGDPDAVEPTDDEA